MRERLLNRLTGTRSCGLAFVLLGIALSPRHALADRPAGDKPWTRGVTEDAKARAKALLERGNELFLANQPKDALGLYQQALAVWDHPAIQFNAARALVALDRPLEALDRIDKALAYGEGAARGDGVQRGAELPAHAAQPGRDARGDVHSTRGLGGD